MNMFLIALIWIHFIAFIHIIHSKQVPFIDKDNYVMIPTDLDPLSDDVEKIMCISDTHNIWTKQIDINDLPQVDILIHSGDLSMIGDLHELTDWNNWINQYLNVYKKGKYALVISGNHDLTLHESYYNNIGYKNKFVKQKQNTTKCKQQILNVENGIYLQDESITLMNINFYGSPYIPYIGNWAFSKQRGQELKEHWNVLNENIDVLITHGPPYGIGDVVPTHNDAHVGDRDLLNKIKEIKPQYHIFGHIHEGFGIYSTFDLKTVFVNAAMLDESYAEIHKPIVFYVKPDFNRKNKKN
eukprot:477985_1